MKEKLKALYRLSFPEDSDAVVDYFFEHRLFPQNAIWREKQGELTACLFLVEKTLVYCGGTVRLPFVVGLCTHPAHRNQGLAKSLMQEAMERLYADTPFLALYPFSHTFYEKMGFCTPSFDYVLEGEKTSEQNREAETVYRDFCADLDFYIERKESDFDFLRGSASLEGGGFSLLTKEGKCIGYTNGEETVPAIFYRGEKKGTMVRVINARLAASYSGATLSKTICLQDNFLPKNNFCFGLKQGKVTETGEGVCRLDAKELTLALFGQHDEFSELQMKGYLVDRY